MQRMVFLMMVVVVMVVAALPYAGAAICYKCQGYNPHLTEDEVTNNKHCPKGDFQKNKVPTSKDIVCIYMVEEMDGTEITVRDVAGIMVTPKKAKTTYINFSGFFCDTDYCNTAPNTRALCLPLLFVPLLASLLRSFA